MTKDNAPTYVTSDDEDETPARSRPPTRAAKRARADSSPLTERVWVVAARKPSIAASISSIAPSSRPASPTPSESQAASSAPPSEVDSVAPSVPKTKLDLEKARHKKTSTKRVAAPNQDAELEDSKKRIAVSSSNAYEGYSEPVIDLRDNPPKYHIFTCNYCSKQYRRLIGESYTSSLRSHRVKCVGPAQQTSLLEDHGIFGVSAKPTPEEVRERMALWVSESARPYSIIDDRQLQHLYSRDVRESKPHRTTVSLDIKRIYEITQKDIADSLAESPGVFHIGLDMCTTDNGYDYLGIVLFRPVLDPKRVIYVDRFVLECLNFKESHTGHQLAKITVAVLRKFKIQDRVWGLVCDSAANNGTMTDCFLRYGLKRLTGEKDRLCCLLHVFNLVAQGITLPFRKKRQHLESLKHVGDDDEDVLGMDVQMCEEDEDGDDDDGTAASGMMLDADDDIEDFDDELEDPLPVMRPGSAEERAFFIATAVLYKLARHAKKTRYNPRERAAFKDECEKQGLPKPHTVNRDQITRWNSTGQMLEDGERTFDGIVEHQKKTCPPAPLRLEEMDRQTIKMLLMLLKPLKRVTDICARAGMPTLGDVLVHYDSLTFEYTKIVRNNSLPLYVRHGAQRARCVLNKYYQKSDESEMYRLGVLLHPSMRVKYLEFARWESDWIETAVEIVERCWNDHYKPAVTLSDTSEAPNSCQFAYSSYLDELRAALDTPEVPESPVRDFVYGAQVFEPRLPKGTLVNPLVWWQGQRAMGNEMNGMTQMAIDVMTAPASSVDVERAFSFLSTTVGKRRHNLAPYSIQATTTLGCYSKAGLVKRGCLVRALASERAASKAAAAASSKTT